MLKHIPFILLFFLIFAVSAVVIVLGGWYPAAVIRMSPALQSRTSVVWARDVRQGTHATRTYYTNLLSVPSSTLSQALFHEREASYASLESLIEAEFIAALARTVVTDAEINMRVHARIAGYRADPHFDEAIAFMYGLDTQSFIDAVIRPAVERELAQEKKQWSDEAFVTWLAEEKQKAQVVRFILVPSDLGSSRPE